MQEKPTNADQSGSSPDQDTITGQAHPLRNLSEDEFAALGGENMVFVRSISARELALFLPEAKSMPGDVQFQMIMAANGAPVLVSDSQTALLDWFEQNDFDQVQRH